MEEGKINESERAQMRKKEVCIYGERGSERQRSGDNQKRQAVKQMDGNPTQVCFLSVRSVQR